MSKVFKTIGKAFKSLFPKIPKIETPVLPDPGSLGAKMAARKKIEKRRQAGREGTIYTPYGGQNLGGTG